MRPNWLVNDRFWYRNTIPQGSEFVLVDPAAKSRTRLFDQARLATALSQVADTSFDAFHLPFTTLDLSADGKSITVDARAKPWICDLVAYRCVPSGDHSTSVSVPPQEMWSQVVERW